MRLSRGRVAATGGIVGLALAGCGQQAHGPRVALAAYLRSVQRVERESAKPLQTITKVGSHVAQVQVGRGLLAPLAISSEEVSLRRALARLTALRSRLAAIPPPASARKLRGLLLTLARREAELTRELAELAVYLPRFNSLMLSLGPAAHKLQLVLGQHGARGAASVAATYRLKAAALLSFSKSVDKISSQIVRLKPPAVSAPGYRTQLSSLRMMSADARNLATELVSGNVRGITPLLTQFDRAATLSQTVPAQRAQIAAAKAFNLEVDSLTQLDNAVAAERQLLDATLR
jgi:hypothetical protein